MSTGSRRSWQQFKASRAGNRFQERYHYRQQGSSDWLSPRKVLYIVGEIRAAVTTIGSRLPRESATLAQISSVGNINHLWITVSADPPDNALERDSLRKLVLKMYWDGEEESSVLVPLGDFFGMGHAKTGNFVSSPLQMSPQDGRSFNCFFHMPFASGARIEVESELSSSRPSRTAPSPYCRLINVSRAPSALALSPKEASQRARNS